jgi:hypothetical protein
VCHPHPRQRLTTTTHQPQRAVTKHRPLRPGPLLPFDLPRRLLNVSNHRDGRHPLPARPRPTRRLGHRYCRRLRPGARVPGGAELVQIRSRERNRCLRRRRGTYRTYRRPGPGLPAAHRDGRGRRPGPAPRATPALVPAGVQSAEPGPPGAGPTLWSQRSLPRPGVQWSLDVPVRQSAQAVQGPAGGSR